MQLPISALRLELVKLSFDGGDFGLQALDVAGLVGLLFRGGQELPQFLQLWLQNLDAFLRLLIHLHLLPARWRPAYSVRRRLASVQRA